MVLRAELAEQLETVEVGDHDVQDEELGSEGVGDRERLVAGAGGAHVESDEPQAGAHHVGDVGLVVDDQDPGRQDRV